MPPHRSSSSLGANHRFPPEHRIRRRAHYQTVQQRGFRVQTANFTWLLMANVEGSRLGITANKRVGNAVRRNRIKRILREVFRRHPDMFPIHCDIVAIPRSQSLVVSYWQVLEEVKGAQSRLRLPAPRSAPTGKP